MNLQETAWFALKEQRKYGTEEFEEVWVIHEMALSLRGRDSNLDCKRVARVSLLYFQSCAWEADCIVLHFGI